MCKDPEAGEGAWCGRNVSPGDSASQGRDLFYAPRWAVRGVIFLLTFLTALGGRIIVRCCRWGNGGLRMGRRCLAGLCSLGSTWWPLRGPGPGAVDLAGVIAHRGSQRRRGLSCDLGPHAGCEWLLGTERAGRYPGPPRTVTGLLSPGPGPVFEPSSSRVHAGLRPPFSEF